VLFSAAQFELLSRFEQSDAGSIRSVSPRRNHPSGDRISLIISIGGFLGLDEFVTGSDRASKPESENHQEIHSMVLLVQSLSGISSRSDEG
jgi:hypothetical protein